MSKIAESITKLLINLKASVREVPSQLPFDYSQVKETNGLPAFLKVGTLLGVASNNYHALLPLKNIKGIAFKLNDTNREEIHLAIQSFILQIIERSPENFANVTVIDTKKMGSNFRPLRKLAAKHLAHFVADDELIKKVLDEHYAKSVRVITECLTQYDTLAEYNMHSGHIEPFRILAIADLPHSFSNLDRLEALLQNAYEAGVWVFFSYDMDLVKSMPNSFQEKFNQILTHFQDTLLEEYGDAANDYYRLSNLNRASYEEAILPSGVVKLILSNDINAAATLLANTENISTYDALLTVEHYYKYPGLLKNNIGYFLFENYTLQLDRKDISIDNINERLSKLNNIQSTEINPMHGVRIPIGKAVGRSHYLTFGLETDNYSAIIGGQAGKGKSNLLNNIIVGGMRQYSANELRFAIIDCSGVGFHEFNEAPNIELLCRSSNVEVCIKAVEYIEKEFVRREDLFKHLGIADINKFNEKSTTKLPRLICLIDEFHVLYAGKERYSSYFDNILVDKVIRIGRKFGIHLVLCTQSLGGGVRRSILDNIPLRIALGMTADQSNSFLGMRNDAAANLERGMAVYNPHNGNISSNKLVKIDYLSESDIAKAIEITKQQNSEIQQFNKVNL